MQNNLKLSNKPLTVIITSPQPMANKLGEKIKALGFYPEILPTIEFVPISNQAALTESIRALSNAHIAIFVSPRAAHFGMNAIVNYCSSLPTLQYVCMGPGTKQALQSYGITDILIPASPPYESESLLGLPELQQVINKKIVIFRGNGGRDLLFETLIQKQAEVSIIECYQRNLPNINLSDHLSFIKDNDPSLSNTLSPSYPPVIITTSREGLNNLITLLKPEWWPRFQNFPIIVVGPRMLQQAKELGLRQCFQSLGADDASLIKALTQVKTFLAHSFK